jgi:RNA polymerase sigma-70 factor (ECF subfamily)
VRIEAAAAEEVAGEPSRSRGSTLSVALMKESLSEAALLDACHKGHADAFRRLFEGYKDRVYSFAFYLSRNETMAKDLTQQTFLSVLVKFGEFRGQAKLSTWLYRLVVNLYADERRRQKRWSALSAITPSQIMSEKSPQEDRLAQREIALAVKQAIESLKPRLRAAVALKYLDNLSYQEIAEVLGCSIGTVASRLNRGHRLLARKLAYLRSSLQAEE